MSFFDELKRRNVFRVAIAYLVASWLLLQIVDVLGPILELPGSAGKLVFLILVIGLVPALIFSWAYEMTPEGLRRETELAANRPISRYTARKLDKLTIVLLLIVAGIVLLDHLIPERAGPIEVDPGELIDLTAAIDDRQSVAVMPFINMSDDEANEYFSDGISEELLNVLVGIENLRVPSRTSSFTFKGGDKKLSEIGRELGVEHVLEGSVRKSANRIRVTAQLIDVRTDTQIWSEIYTRELDDIFSVQEEIAQSIVVALQLTLSGADQERMASHSTSNVAAYNEYLLGRHFWNKRTAHSLQTAAQHLRSAVELDPNFDQAWAALADTYVIFPEYKAGTIEESIPRAREAVIETLAINPDSARALAASGYLKANYDYDWEGANADFARAVMLEPGYANARQWYAETLNQQRRSEEALVQLAAARIADPLSAVVRHVPGYVLLWSSRFDEAEVHYMDALELGGEPLRWTIHNLDVLNTLRGDYDEARKWARQLAQIDGIDAAADLARIDAVENPALKERALLLLAERPGIGDGVFGRALQLALLGEYDLALDNLEKAFAAGDPYAASMYYMNVYEPLHDEPRFQAMLKEMNLLH